MQRIQLGSRTVLLDAHAVESPNGRESLTPLEVDLLRYLNASQTPVSRGTLLVEVWGYSTSVRSRAVHHAVTRLRRKLEDDPSKPVYLKTVRGLGYELCTPSPKVEAPPAIHTPDIFGRDDDLAALAEAVQTPGLVTVLGPGGVGKTHLVSHLLRRIGTSARLCALALSTSHESMAAEVCRTLGIAPTVRPDAVARAAQGQGIQVLILDNLEQAVPAARTLVSGLVKAAPSLCVLTTSRVPLQLPMERTWVVPCLPLPTGPTLALAQSSPAVQLFVDRVRRLQPTFQLTDSNRSDVADVLAAVDGHPLAVELAAPRTRALALPDLARRLRDDIGILRARHHDGEPRHQTLTGVLQSSYDALPAAEQQLFAQLSCFAGSFTLDAVEAVAGQGVLDGMETLLEHSLIVSDEGRLRLLVPVRAFAHDVLSADAELYARTLTRHRTLYAQLGTTQALREADRSVEQAGRLATERHNLTAACLRSIDAGDAACAVHALAAAVEGLRATAQHAECLELADAVAGMKSLTAAQRLQVEIIAAVGLQQVSRRGAALTRLAASRPCSATELNASRLRLLAELHADNGDFDASEVAFAQAMDQVSEAEFEWTRAEVLAAWARVAADRGRHDEALTRYESALTLIDAQGRSGRLAPVATNYANIHRGLGNLTEASRWYERAIRSAAAGGAQRVEAVTRCNRAVSTRLRHLHRVT